MRFYSFVVGFLFLLSACAGDHKYPYPAQFVAPTDLSETVLPAPPAVGSDEMEREIKFIVTKQAALTAAQKAIIIAENKITPEMMMYSVLGTQYTRERHPALYTLLGHAASDAWRIGDVNQDYWKSLRPWMADERVKLIAPKITRYGYPSGHTTTNTVWAHVLSELFPTKKASLFARANEIANHRMMGGVHFPHDLDGGRTLAAEIFTKMKANPEFQRELEDARIELNSGKLPRVKLDSPAASRCGEMHC
jgi:acid phosphatase (class A)